MFSLTTPRHRDYTMTQAQWYALGGTPAPFDYDPDVLKRVEPVQRVMGREQHHHTGLVDAAADVLSVWEEIAEQNNVKLLSIRWPDAHYPDFAAIPRDSA